MMRLEGLRKFNKFSDLIGTRKFAFTACSIMPEPNTLPRVPLFMLQVTIINVPLIVFHITFCLSEGVHDIFVNFFLKQRKNILKKLYLFRVYFAHFHKNVPKNVEILLLLP
jgi:hypothetical protein